MKTRIVILLSFLILLCLNSVKAQWVVTDPTNLAQSIVNTSNEMLEATKTVNNTMESFKETQKIHEQGKKFYDALKAINNLVKDALKVQKIVLYIGEIGEIYVTNFQIMLNDDNYTYEELDAIAIGYQILLEESRELLDEVKTIITPNGLSMSDSERMLFIDKIYHKVKDYKNLVAYYTSKNISVSLIRAEGKGVLHLVLGLYCTPMEENNEKYW